MYRIKDWALHFENAESRKIKGARWLPLPNKMDGKGLRRLTKHPDRVQIYCAWVFILQFASKAPVRGELADENGPLTAEDLADVTDFPVEIFDLAFRVLQEPRYGWIEDVPWSNSETFALLRVHPDVPGARPGPSGRPGNEGKGTEGNRTEGTEDPPPNPRPPVVAFDQAVTDVLAAYPKFREREGGRKEAVHVGEGDRGQIAEFMNANPDYPLLAAVKLYARTNTRPMNLRAWLQNPTAREIVLKASQAAKERDSPAPTPTGPLGPSEEDKQRIAQVAHGIRFGKPKAEKAAAHGWQS